MANIHKPTSRYVNTDITDFYLDIWDSIEIPASASDIEIELGSQYHERPDKLAYDTYGTSRLWWVFAVRNKDILFDPIYDFKAGVRIFVPSQNRIEEII